MSVQSSFTYDESIDATPVYTLFEAETTDRLTQGHLLRLAAGIVGLVQVKGFFSTSECESIVKALDLHEMGAYNFTPPIAKLGPAAYDFYKTGLLSEEYFAKAELDGKSRSSLLDGDDPLLLATSRLADVWGSAVEPATSEGRTMYAGMIREINKSALMHFDEVVRECPTAMDLPPVAQIAFNCHLTKPNGGGDAVVFRRKWMPADEQHRDGYGYQGYLTEGEPSLSANPDVGDVVLFDPRNYHLVTPVASGRRITLSFFIGVTGMGPLIVWS